MDANEIFAEEPMDRRRIHHTVARTVGGRDMLGDPRRLRCADVARNRAARYARKRRIPKPLGPLITALILVSLFFERRPISAPKWAGKHPIPGSGDNEPELLARASDREDHEAVVRPDPDCLDGAVDDDPKPEYRPPSHFLAKDAAQIVSFLIRNRGRIDNDAVRMKWNHLDYFLLPLAVYLRRIEFSGSWGDLENEISSVPTYGPVVSGSDMPKSSRHRKILELFPEWTLRGEKLLSGDWDDGARLEPTDTADGDDPDTKPPKP